MTKLHDYITRQEQELENMEIEPAPSGEWYEYNYEYYAQDRIVDTLMEVEELVGSCEYCKYQLSTEEGTNYRDCILCNVIHKKEWYCADFEKMKDTCKKEVNDDT